MLLSGTVCPSLSKNCALMERARRDYERENGTVSACDFLQLLITDPSFAWLCPLSELMADIDHAHDADPGSEGRTFDGGASRHRASAGLVK